MNGANESLKGTKAMKIMGIDSSSQKTGIAIYNGELKYSQLIDFSKIKEDYNTRFSMMTKEIQKVIEMNQPDVVYVEDTWERGMGFANTATVKKLSYIIGAVWQVCILNDIPFNLIYPSEWRKTLGFKTSKLKRAELKQMSVDYVKDTFNLDVDDNQADAICIAVAGWMINKKLFEQKGE